MKERQGQTIADLFREGQTPKAIFKVTGFPVPIPSLFNELEADSIPAMPFSRLFPELFARSP